MASINIKDLIWAYGSGIRQELFNFGYDERIINQDQTIMLAFGYYYLSIA